MIKSRDNLIGAWAFLIGVVLAIVLGLFNSFLQNSYSNFIYIFLVVLGFIIGLANFEDRDSMTFLIACIALVIVSALGQQTLLFISGLNPILGYLTSTLNALLVMFVPATIIVALKTVFSISTS
jgi:hypothetical protein